MTRRLPPFPLASTFSGAGSLSLGRAGLLLAATLGAAAPLPAQMHKVDAPQRVTRAIAVYEYTGTLDHPTAARLVPVSLFINGHFEDAGDYLARPVPFTLDAGDVYFIEKAGDHLGTFDLDEAGHVVTNNALNDDNPEGAWYGFGKFAPPVPPAPVKKLPASSTLPVIQGSDDDSRPHFIRRDPPKAAANPPISHSPAPSADDSDRPTMTRRDAPATTTADSDDDSPDDRPTLRHRDDSKKSKKRNDKPQASVTGPADSLFDDPDRPTLGAGKPEADETPQLKGLPADLHQAIAVSDAANREPHLFTRDWDSSTDRAQTLAQLEALARPRIAAYIAANKLQPVAAGFTPPPPSAGTVLSTVTHDDNDQGPPQLITKADAEKAAAASAAAKPASTTKPSTTTAHKATRPAPTRRSKAHLSRTTSHLPLSLTNEQLNGYELTYGGLPTFTYTAESPVATGGPVYITLVAQRLPSGELQLAFHTLTDASHLDRTPWFRPIDVVDPNASHRASILFELRAQHSRQFALYRLVTAEAEQTFTTGVIE